MSRFYERTRRLWIVGDSIGGRGFALGNHADLISTSHVMYGFSSAWRMMNLILAENVVNIRAEPYNIGTVTQANLATDLGSFAASSSVGERDFFVIQDAGAHNGNPTTYQSALEGLAVAIRAARPNATIRFTTTMDNAPAADDSKWDLSISGTTMNQAIIAAGAAQGVTVIDTNTIITSYWTSVFNTDGVVLPAADKIHLLVWDQMKWAGAVLASLLLTPAIINRASLTAIASANQASLAYSSGTWTQQKAIDYCVAILG